VVLVEEFDFFQVTCERLWSYVGVCSKVNNVYELTVVDNWNIVAVSDI
jgi:hypothetical protein